MIDLSKQEVPEAFPEPEPVDSGFEETDDLNLARKQSTRAANETMKK